MWSELEMWYKPNRDTPVITFVGSFDDSADWIADNIAPDFYNNESYIVLDEPNRSLMVRDADCWFMVVVARPDN